MNALLIGLEVLAGLLVSGLVVGWTVGSIAKLGGPEDRRPGPVPDPLLAAPLYPHDDGVR